MVNIVLDPERRASKRKSSRLQARFDKLQDALRRQERLNQTFRRELDSLVALYQNELWKRDAEQIAPLTVLAERLIAFFSRKSLSQWHRDELAEWIKETIGRIQGVEPETAARLHERFRETVAAHLDMSPAQMEEELRALQEDMAEASDASDEIFEEDPQQDLFGFDDIFGQGDIFEQDDIFEQEAGAQGDDPPEEEEVFDPDAGQRGRRIMDGSWARSVFRRAAQALHPDREPDPARREVKQRRMQELLEARSQGDIMNLLRLYGESVSENELVLAEQEMVAACELMEERLEELREEHAALAYEDPVRMMVLELLYSPSKKERESNIRSWKRQLKAEAKHTSRLAEQLRNLTVLKEVLEERREQRVFEHLDLIFEGMRF